MSQKMEMKQLQALSLNEVKEYKAKAEQRKLELEALRAKGGKAWTDELQDELYDVVEFIVDVDKVIKEKSTEDSETKNTYTPAAGTENMVHVKIVRGRRFNPLTGKDESPAYRQIFTFAEWQIFKKTYRGLGYNILEILHNPYEDASNLVTK